ncbi:hypothetical protein FOG51_02739 [Hanseniaspora uvarum]|nr:hypothetical protein FOG48_02655 [Hanseniaspora uvarum]KAF0272260.1 hypothetical protein FOG51_02739 [Hanseniaspora uvarum]KKA01971.1 Dolichyl pyrophosphate Man9GlcNAc2 alpha-1,3-glucosyltransferase [Hanseniaspora uvarum DSM 2768]
MTKKTATLPKMKISGIEMLQKEKKTLQTKFRNKYFIFQTNIFQILTLFPQVLLTWDIALITLLGILVRSIVGLNDFAEDNTPILTNTFENHRSWIDFASKLSLQRWYTSKTISFELDQPIIVGYHSILMSYIGNYLFDGRHKSWFTIKTLKTNEMAELRSFMKFTVCLTDMFMYIPPAIWFAKRYGRLVAENTVPLKKVALKPGSSTFENAALGHLKQLINFINSLIILFQPTLLFIDHGLFGYHGFTLGALLLSINNIFDNKLGGACVFYILALCFDQNSIFCAPVFVLYFLRMTILSLSLFDFASIIITILMTLALLYFPMYIFLDSREEGIKLLKNSLYKIYSLSMFDTKKEPSNIWLFFKNNLLNGKLTNQELKVFSLVFIAISIIPTCVFILIKCSKNNKPQSKVVLLYGLASCSLSFYLFSYEFDYKSVLIPILPLTLLIVKYNQINSLNKTVNEFGVNNINLSLQRLFVIQNISMYSLWPLVADNGLGVFVQYVLIICLYNWLFGRFSFSSTRKLELISNTFYAIFYLVMISSVIVDKFFDLSLPLKNGLNHFMFALSHFSFFISWLWLQFEMWNI